jgi:hypothetical protein
MASLAALAQAYQDYYGAIYLLQEIVASGRAFADDTAGDGVARAPDGKSHGSSPKGGESRRAGRSPGGRSGQ